jgi:hypothetical protein
VPDPSVQPPEGLRKIIVERLADRFAHGKPDDGMFVRFTAEDGYSSLRGVTPAEAVDAVLAALFDACEVRERWGTRWTYADGEQRTAWWMNRAEAETERDWPTPASTVELLRRCDLQTPPEPQIDS